MKKRNIKVILALIIFIVVIVVAGILISKNKSKENTKLMSINKLPQLILREDGVARYISKSEITTKLENDKDVYKVLEEIKGYFKIDDPKSVLKIKNVQESAEFKYYKLSQEYCGVIVYGNELVIAVNKDNEVTSITGKYTPISNVKIYSKISISEMKENLNTILDENYEILSEMKYIYIKDDTPVYCYAFTVVTINGIYEILIDAEKSVEVARFAKSSASNYSYTGKDIYGNYKTISMNKTVLGNYQLHDNNRNISIVNATNVGVNPERDENGDIKDWGTALTMLAHLYLRQAPAVVDICKDGMLSTNYCITSDTNFIRNSIIGMYNFAKTYDYYYNVLGRKSYDNKGAEISVNIGAVNDLFGSEEYFNASWIDGYSSFVFGSSNGISFAAALDVVAHEFTHAVSGSIVGLVYKNESGALNEAYSDILGALVEGKNFQLGEDLGGFRDMTDPNKYKDPKIKGGKYYFPNDIETYNAEWIKKAMANQKGISDWTQLDNGGVHTNSGVPNYAAFLMYDNNAFSSKQEMAKVWYNSLFLLSSNADFEDCALAVIESAKNLGISEDKIMIIENAFITTNMLGSEYGSISGKVISKDNNKPLEGALVTAINQLNPHVNYQTTTNNKGEYQIDGLATVDYVVTFEMPKYHNVEEKVKVTKDNELSLDVKLEKINESEYDESEIVFVLDVSSSMDSSDPTNIRKQIIQNIVLSLSDGSKVALVTFTGTAKLINNGLSDKSIDKKILITDIFNMVNDSGYNSDSGTNGRAGLSKAIDLFDKQSQTRKYIVFLTDGEDNKFVGATYDEIISIAAGMNIRILSIGLGQGDQIDENVLIKLATGTDGKYYHATKSSNLYEFDRRIFAELK